LAVVAADGAKIFLGGSMAGWRNLVFVFASLLVLVATAPAQQPAQPMDEARRIQAGVLGVDSHNDTLQRVLIEGVDIGQRLPDGSNHVGIGSDFDGVPSLPLGLEDVSKMPALTAALLKRGYKEKDIQKIMGGNFLRVVREVVGD
jgi:hypothetical protein